MSSDLQDLPLPALFQRAEATFQKLQSSSSTSTQTQLINDALACLDRASLLVDSLGLFSSNEDKDDLTTGEIKYLLVPYYKAEFLTQRDQNYVPSTTTSDDVGLLKHQKARLTSLKSVEILIENFLLQAQQYDVLSSSAVKCLSAVLGRDGVTQQPLQLDASTLRELKIEKFKLEKSVAARIEAISHHLGKSINNNNEKENGYQDEDEDEDNEVAERELQLLKIESAALKSIESLRTVRQEIKVLVHATNLTDEERRNRKSNLSSQEIQQQQSTSQDLLAELRKAAGALKIGQDAIHRESLRKGVFQPSHILPTLTVEQQGDIEVAQILAQQRAEAEKMQRIAAEKEARGRKGDDSEEDDEFEGKVYRQRAMDDWKDDNPRGWGNSKLKPCG